MTYQELIAYFGSQSKAAKAIGINQSSVSLWKAVGIPALRQLHIEKVTNGALKADEVEMKKATA